MISLSKSIITLCALTGTLGACLLVAARPATSAIRYDDLPKLSDTLAVAKSPFEPFTLEPNNPGARNEGVPAAAATDLVASTSLAQPESSGDERPKSTRSSQPEEESAAATSGGDLMSEAPAASTTLANSASSESSEAPAEPATSLAPDATEAPEAPESTTAASTLNSEQPSVGESTPSPVRNEPPSEVRQPVEISPLTTEAASTAAPAVAETTPVPPPVTTTEKPVEETTLPPALPPAAATTEAPATAAATEAAPEIGSSVAPAAVEAAVSSEAPSSEAPSSEAVSSETPSTEPPTTVGAHTDKASAGQTIQTTTIPPTTTTEPPPPPPSQPTTTSTLPPPAPSSEAPIITSTSEKPASIAEASSNGSKRDKGGDSKDESKAISCNHLPTYEADEIQKVFREETTFKNGTIKGKFTYINFDQRYRLVHYTRLPYGPVRIDLVEELGKPEQANGAAAGSNQSSSPNTSVNGGEIPNAVLQLRNILPNSLYGFPFVGPASSIAPPASPAVISHNINNNNIRPTEHKDGGHGGDDKSNAYYYSTDSISTPNLLTPSVPVALVPGQRKISQPINAPMVDTFGPSFYENLPVGQYESQTRDRQLPQQQQASARSAPADLVPGPLGPGQSPPDGSPKGSPPAQAAQARQFQYTQAAPQAAEPNKQTTGPMYSYLLQAQQLQHYQYSPLPLYSFHQPNYYSAAQRQPVAVSQPNHLAQNRKLKAEQHSQDPSFIDNSAPVQPVHQTHQPHSHEHYIAPFMHVQPASQSNAETPRLKVKSFKALNTGGHQESYGKSSQLRAGSQSGQYSGGQPPFSPSQNARLHRHRSGKQNQELKSNVNTSPVVYHVLRSPLGRVYSLPQYHQEYAMAYDHED